MTIESLDEFIEAICEIFGISERQLTFTQRYDLQNIYRNRMEVICRGAEESYDQGYADCEADLEEDVREEAYDEAYSDAEDFYRKSLEEMKSTMNNDRLWSNTFKNIQVLNDLRLINWNLVAENDD